MEVLISHLGRIEYQLEEVITFEGGLYGFEAQHRFIIVQGGTDSIFSYLQCIEAPFTTFVVCQPRDAVLDYVLSMERRDYDALGFENEADMLILTIATIPEKIEDLSINLLGPIVINTKNKMGKQVIDQNSEYVTKHKIYQSIETQAKAKVG